LERTTVSMKKLELPNKICVFRLAKWVNCKTSSKWSVLRTNNSNVACSKVKML
jgi:hypothetical protein